MENKPSRYKAELDRFNAKLKLCEDNIEKLMTEYRNETDQNQKNDLKRQINEYKKHADNIKRIIKKYYTERKLIDRFNITHGSTGYTYELIFGRYLTNNIQEIEIEEPYLMKNFQLTNLISFIELILKNCPNLKRIRLTTQPSPRPPQTEIGNDIELSEQEKCFMSLTEDLKKRNISLDIEFSTVLHKREIIFSNGYVFKIDRGLDYFKSREGHYVLGLVDYHFRECKETEIHIFKCEF